jgi:hypothetical protein
MSRWCQPWRPSRRETRPELTATPRADIYPSLILAHEKQTRGDTDKYAKMYGTLCRILSDELRDKVMRASNYVQASERSNPIALWAIIVATAGMHLDPGAMATMLANRSKSSTKLGTRVRTRACCRSTTQHSCS